MCIITFKKNRQDPKNYQKCSVNHLSISHVSIYLLAAHTLVGLCRIVDVMIHFQAKS